MISKHPSFQTVEFVCAGNVSRSKIAKAAARKYSLESGLDKYFTNSGSALEITSSGIFVSDYNQGRFQPEAIKKMQQIASGFPNYREMDDQVLYLWLSLHDANFRDLVLAEKKLQVYDSVPRQTKPEEGPRLIVVFDKKIEEAVNNLYSKKTPERRVVTLWEKVSLPEPGGSLDKIRFDSLGKPELKEYQRFAEQIIEATIKLMQNEFAAALKKYTHG